ncbi:uncharacterized protein [Physcomitrium patens]|uniref:Uncharacterized protein n=1 Tax=Physcomitrium patens TaxID=3218 RepID=A0A2K1L076_PHYPA|nr:uncharacterized protein LOC112294265 [Physcomitrium patens]PNR59425.1 hypothetical protein PHYPA_002216 [Physcomitrium patens]|eukprot:XP_024400330.1 uncharacterized protein LOC112294265 [Physcomitrella patens]
MPRCSGATAWCDHYDVLQTCAVVLLYMQVGCAFVGSLGVVHTGIVLANLALALFALIAIESGSQSLGRAYAGFLSLSLLLDIVWFCLFANEIRDFWNDTQLGKFGALSVKLTFWMQVSGSGLRLISSFLWCQMYRLGTDSETLGPQGPVDFGRRTPIFASFNLDDPTLGDDTESEVLGGSIYDTATFSSLFENFSRQDYPDIENNGHMSEDESSLQKPLIYCGS